MDLNDIIKLQCNFDKDHGWTLDSDSSTELIKMVSNDLIGMLGEFGEFANIIKKLKLIEDKSVLRDQLGEQYTNLEEELVDTFIYLIRIASHLNLDLEKAYHKKLAYNKKKYAIAK